MPGMPTNIVDIVTSDMLSAAAVLGIIGNRSLCETVTTGKCLIGLICGSMSRFQANLNA